MEKDYSSLLDRFIVVLVVMETSGIFLQWDLARLRKLGVEWATSFLIQKISITVQRGNVASILGTLPPGKELVIPILFYKKNR